MEAVLRGVLVSVLLAGAWGCALLAGVWGHVPILGLLALPAMAAALVFWLVAFAGLPAVTTGRLPRRLAVAGGVLLLLVVAGWGSAAGDELLRMQREHFRETLRNLRVGLDLYEPLMVRAGPALAVWMVPWLGGLGLAGLAARMRAGVGWGWIVLWAVIYTAILFLIPLLLLHGNFPLST